ncbi:MAG TPA: hypothetical protein VFN70_18280 [Burkholderiales bacterium]|nr:hypothetical protein [Burkholderiales bacterium]
MARPDSRRAPRDGRCTKYLMTGAGRCPNDALDGEIRCATHLAEHKGWGSRLVHPRRRNKDGEIEPLPTILPAWMSDPTLLPKRPPGRM